MIMRVEEYRAKMQSLGWTDKHIDRLVNLYSQCSRSKDDEIDVLEGDFIKKNLRRFEYMES